MKGYLPVLLVCGAGFAAGCGDGISKKWAPSSSTNNGTSANNGSTDNGSTGIAPANSAPNNPLMPNNVSPWNASTNNASANNTSTTNGQSNNTSTNNPSNNATNNNDDCAVTGCQGLTYCDQDEGICKPGCERSDQCAGEQLCTIDNSCECPEGTHLCGTRCAPDDSVSSCGDRCAPCPADPNGVASCESGGTCGLACNTGFEMCGGQCAACPAGPGVTSTTCDGTQCVAVACADGYRECASGCCPWNVEVVYSGDSWSLDAAIDSNDVIHVSFADYVNYDLVYATQSGNGWSTTTVESSGMVGFGSAIALDAADRPHIVHGRSTADEVGYAFLDGSWQTEALASGTLWNLDILSYGNERLVSFSDSTDTDVRLARRTGPAMWEIETIDSTDAGGDTALVVDGSGAPHIAYQAITGKDLVYAVWTGTSWQHTTVDTQGDVAAETSIALDSSGRPHIVYLDLTSLNDVAVKYAYFDGTSWNVEFIDSDHAGEYATIALDDQDVPHVAYRDLGDRSLQYAFHDGTTWQIQTVDDGEAGWYARLVLDSNGDPHIIHLDLTDQEIRHVW